MTNGQGVTGSKPRSAVDTLLAYRKGKRAVIGGFVVFLLMPLFCFLLIGTGLPVPFVILGFVLAILTGLVWMAIPVLLVGATVFGLGAVLKSNMTQTFGAQGIFVPPSPGLAPTITPSGDAPASPLAAMPLAGIIAPALAADEPAAEPAGPSVEAAVAAIAAELELVRRDIAEKRKATLGPWVGIVAALSFGIPLVIVIANGGRDWMSIPIAGLIFTVGAWAVISQAFEKQFAAAFKEKLLPVLLSRHGDVQRRADYAPGLQRGQATGTIWAHDRVSVDDGFIGTYRGHRLAMADLVLHRDQGTGSKRKTTNRRVLTISVTLDGPVPATTAVVDSGLLGEGKRRLDPALQKVTLEDVVFEKVYDVYATDQIGARAVLTPAVMERMLKMSDAGGFLPPMLLAEDETLQFALYTTDDRDLFEPLSVADDNIRGHVAKLESDLVQVFGLVDVAIDVGLTLAGRRRRAEP